MPNYEQMYRELFNAITEAITILQDAQQSTEETYISNRDPIIQVLPRREDNKSEGNDAK